MNKRFIFISVIAFLALAAVASSLVVFISSPYHSLQNRTGTVWQPDEIIGYTSLPDACQRWETYFDQGEVTECTGRFGQRRISNIPSPCRRNVFILGDSLAWADGINGDETFSFYLQEKLKRENLCVYNFGASGYSFLQMHLRIKHEIYLLLNPDDILIVAFSLDSVSRDIYGPFASGSIKPAWRIKENKLILSGLRDTNTFNRIPLLRRPGAWLMSTLRRADAKNLYTYLVNDLIELAEKKHIHVHFVLLPFEREIRTQKTRAIHQMIRKITPEGFLTDTFPSFREYARGKELISQSRLYRVHYNRPTQKFLAGILTPIILNLKE